MSDETLMMPIEMPATDEAKKEKIKVNNLQENFIFLLNESKDSLAAVQKETMIPWATLYGWYIGEVASQMLDLNVKELADYFNVTVDTLAFSDLKKEREDGYSR